MKYIALTLLLLNAALYYYQDDIRDRLPELQSGKQVRLAGDRLKLLAEEQEERLKQKLSQVITSPLVVADNPASQDGCLALGPFPGVVDSSNMVERLRSLGLSVTQRPVDTETGTFDYRVLIPPLASLEAAFRKLRELQARDIDSYVITQGANALGISMGVFSSKEAAEGVQADLLRLGYETDISQIPQFEREYWIFSQTEADLEIEAGVLQQISGQAAGIELSRQVCENPA